MTNNYGIVSGADAETDDIYRYRIQLKLQARSGEGSCFPLSERVPPAPGCRMQSRESKKISQPFRPSRKERLPRVAPAGLQINHLRAPEIGSMESPSPWQRRLSHLRRRAFYQVLESLEVIGQCAGQFKQLGQQILHALEFHPQAVAIERDARRQSGDGTLGQR